LRGCNSAGSRRRRMIFVDSRLLSIVTAGNFATTAAKGDRHG
jgi:hypothetical protein